MALCGLRAHGVLGADTPSLECSSVKGTVGLKSRLLSHSCGPGQVHEGCANTPRARWPGLCLCSTITRPKVNREPPLRLGAFVLNWESHGYFILGKPPLSWTCLALSLSLLSLVQFGSIW